MQDLNLNKQLMAGYFIGLGNAIGNGNLIRSIFDESEKIWDRAIDLQSEGHMIARKLGNDAGKLTAISDYALQVVQMFIESKHPNLSLFAKRAFTLSVDHRKAVISLLSHRQYDNNANLFKAVMTELVCFDPYLVDFALLPAQDLETRAEALTWFLGSMTGDIVTPEDWSFTCEDTVLALTGYPYLEKREELVNACLNHIHTGYEDGTDFFDALQTIIRTLTESDTADIQ